MPGVVNTGESESNLIRKRVPFYQSAAESLLADYHPRYSLLDIVNRSMFE